MNNRWSASADVLVGLLRVRSETLDYEGCVRTLCANGAILPVSGRILEQTPLFARQMSRMPLYFFRFETFRLQRTYNYSTCARDVA